jgi:hypothetical protein
MILSSLVRTFQAKQVNAEKCGGNTPGSLRSMWFCGKRLREAVSSESPSPRTVMRSVGNARRA